MSTPTPQFPRSTSKPIIVDAHQDIAWNKVTLGRDFLESVADKRTREGASPAHGEGHALVGFPELIAGNVRIIFATLYVAAARPDRTSWGKTYTSAQEAHDQAMEQIAYYAMLAMDPRVTLITTRSDLDRVLESNEYKIGLVILMEGADPIVTPEQTPEWFDAGVRIVGPAWSQTRYSGGTRAPGPLTELGRALMPQLERAGITLDVSHMAEQSFWDAMELYHGTVIASHSNCRAYVNSDRQLTDEMIKAIAARNGVIGAVIYNRFIKEGWDISARKETVALADLVQHAKHICDLVGDTLSIGIGSDFDGGYGVESTPKEIETVADLQKYGTALSDAGFSDQDIENILGMNWIRLLRRVLPA
ncbi:MAG: membrane dipeptidase [Chloroflexi bacterium]|nr:membrane dipeptidase [Chloroflexota bacterium]